MHFSQTLCKIHKTIYSYQPAQLMQPVGNSFRLVNTSNLLQQATRDSKQFWQQFRHGMRTCLFSTMDLQCGQQRALLDRFYQVSRSTSTHDSLLIIRKITGSHRNDQGFWQPLLQFPGAHLNQGLATIESRHFDVQQYCIVTLLFEQSQRRITILGFVSALNGSFQMHSENFAVKRDIIHHQHSPQL